MNMKLGTIVIKIPGAISMMKSLNVTPAPIKSGYPAFSIAAADRPEPIMMFGGSPIIVAAPPMLEKRTSEMRSGIGLRSSTFAS